MADTMTDLFADVVRDNSTHTVQVRWRDTLPTDDATIELDKKFADTFGYTWHEWDDVDRDGRRVTLRRVVSGTGNTVELYETSYYTRVKCTDCEYSYAGSYLAVTDADGTTHPPAPFCDTHGDVMRRITARTPGHTLHESEPLRIGQHD